ncbi:fluoride efflux transporter CrcB [Pyrinomonas methylaliphatogenes]|uniref:fluoride efflux transporter CrcB n=1 Tax=Pyrinomonas methylaliphatogenes TaxID=454194 RepID=UPI00138DED1A|nr:fluoride efflux transporter CrcB [Pyrinomonas methylaliphatogenes]
MRFLGESRVDTFTKYLMVAIGGAFGAILRYYLSGSVLSRVAAPFPTATFIINISGSFIIGFFLTLVTEHFIVNPHLRLLIAVGFVGAYTTFSTFEYETARLIEDRDFLHAFFYVTLSFAVGLMAVWGGIFAARWMAQAPLLNSIIETERSTQAISGVPVMDELEMANLNGGRESVEPKERS